MSIELLYLAMERKQKIADKIRGILSDTDNEWSNYHYNLWNTNADMYQWSEFMEEFRRFLKLDSQRVTPFDTLWQRHLLLHEDYDAAIQECIDFILGD